jgi:hypothetical protein
MKKAISAVVGLVALVSTGVAFAVGPWSNAVVVSQIEVDSVAAGNGTETYLSFASTPTGKPGCATASQYIMTGSADHVKAMTSIATSALLSGHTVKVYWSGSCTSSYGQILHLAMQ